MFSFRPLRIVSGGQTGVDRAALDAAMLLGIEHGGWCPRGRLAEDGVIPPRYHLDELESADYVDRTEQNVIDSDATLILYVSRLSGGTLLTRRLAGRHGKPCLAQRLDRPLAAQKVRDWLAQHRPAVLNIAGPRGSSHPNVADQARAAIVQIFSDRQRQFDYL